VLLIIFLIVKLLCPCFVDHASNCFLLLLITKYKYWKKKNWCFEFFSMCYSWCKILENVHLIENLFNFKDRCYQPTHQTLNYLVKWHNLYRGTMYNLLSGKYPGTYWECYDTYWTYTDVYLVYSDTYWTITMFIGCFPILIGSIPIVIDNVQILINSILEVSRYMKNIHPFFVMNGHENKLPCTCGSIWNVQIETTMCNIWFWFVSLCLFSLMD
jgi:hypothetical protein